jgi:integrase
MAHIQKLIYKSKRTGKTSATWQARYSAPDGRERTKRFERKVDAEKWLDTNGADVARGTWVDPNAGKVTLLAYSAIWLADRSDLRESTAAKYRHLLDRHIVPELGNTAMANLSPGSVRSWRAALNAKHPSTAAGAYRLLSAICRTAVEDEVIVRSPCRVKGGGAEKAAERPTITVAELATAVENVPERWQLALLLASWCQLRRGEILGLQRRDVNRLHGTITVERTWTVVSGSSPVVGPPKTDAGARKVAVPPNVAPVLERHLNKHVGASRDAWLFSGSEEMPAHPRSLDHAWTKARKKAGREDVRFHDLRHSGLTWAAATGASTAELMRRAGHASPMAAIRYQHATEDRDRVLADALARMAFPAEVVPISDGRNTDEVAASDKAGSA